MISTLKAFLNLIYPLRCQICGENLDFQNERHLCSTCWGKIKLNPPPYCARCGKSLIIKGLCSECRSKNGHHFQRAWSVGLYEEGGVLRQCILLLKYGHKLCLSKPLSKLMLDFVRCHLDLGSIDIIVPVPLHRVRRLERGFNQAELLAHRLSRELNIPISHSKLCRQRATLSQSSLPREERVKNVRGAFQIKGNHPFKGKTILLIDDVITTGTTASECSRILKKAGAKRVEVLTLARGK